MTHRQQLLAMTAAVGLVALPTLAFAQGSGGSSTQPQTTQQQGGPSTSATPRDGSPGNPASTGTQRAADSVTGNRTPPDGTPGNPPGTAAGRAVDNVTGGNRPDGTPGNPPGTAASRAAGAATGAMAVDSNVLRSGRRASKVIGATVYNENNESIGEVDDIMIPASGGAPVAVISVGGFLGIGSKLVAVPYDRLQMGGQGGNRWTMSGATKDSLTGLPTFTYDTAANTRG